VSHAASSDANPAKPTARQIAAHLLHQLPFTPYAVTDAQQERAQQLFVREIDGSPAVHTACGHFAHQRAYCPERMPYRAPLLQRIRQTDLPIVKCSTYIGPAVLPTHRESSSTPPCDIFQDTASRCINFPAVLISLHRDVLPTDAIGTYFPFIGK
jgi:hypothetical protein